MSLPAPLYVQFGCGLCAPPGWLNFDASPTPRFERLPLLGRSYTRNAARFLARLESGDAEAVHALRDGTVPGEAERPRNLLRRFASAAGNARHRWMWDYPALSWELAKAGFVRIRRCGFNDCEDDHFRAVEDKDRFTDSVVIECRR